MVDLLRELLHRKPFKPIRIVTRSGQRHEISDRFRVAVGKTKLMLVSASDRLTELS